MMVNFLTFLQLQNHVDAISGDKTSNLVLAWHGGCSAPYSVANEGFNTNPPASSQIDPGWFGRGTYFTQFLSYGHMYSEFRRNWWNSSMPLILSWVIMGVFQLSILSMCCI